GTMLNRICRNVDIEIEGRHLHAYLIVLDMIDFDVILGVDWLVKYHAVFNYHNLVVEFSLPDGDQFIYKLEVQRPPVLPTYELLEGLALSVAAMMIEDKQRIDHIQIPIVCEYLDVFPEDLPSLPPERGIKFCIDLVPSTLLISKTPYRMAPTELAELK